MKRVILSSVSTLLGVLLLASQPCAAQDIDVTQARAMSQHGALLLDVREPDEYADIHAPNATLIPLGQLGSRLGEIATYKNRPVAVMCRSGRRSAKAVQLLQEAGYNRVSNVGGGILAWENAGLKVVRRQ